jgi:hypothetical protein
MAEESSYLPKAVKIKEVSLLTSGGAAIDIRPQVLEFNLYQDIFTNYISGSVVISDALGLMVNLPIVGQERLTVKFSYMGDSVNYKRYFYVYNVVNRTQLKDRHETYSLRFVSESFMKNLTGRVSKAYSGKISNMVKDIFTEFELDPRNNNTLVNVEETTGDYNYVIPSKRPFNTINWLAGKARSGEAGVNYLFYETNNGYRFESLDTLMGPNAPIYATYSYFPKNLSNRNDIGESYRNAEGLKIIEMPDTIDNINGGVYASTNVDHDIYYKKISTTTFDYISEYKKNNHLTQDIDAYGSFISPLGDFNGVKFNQSYESILSVSPSHSNLFGGNAGDYDDSSIQGQRQESLFGQIGSIRLLITIPGTPEPNVGELVNMNIPVNQPVTVNPVMDKYLSGTYLITKVRHIIRPADFSTVLELSKDSYNTKIPDVKEINL